MTSNFLQVFAEIDSETKTVSEITRSLGLSHRAFLRLAEPLFLIGLLERKQRRDGTTILRLSRSARSAFGKEGNIHFWTEHHRTLFRIWSSLPRSIKNDAPYLRSTHDLDVESYARSLAESYSLSTRKLHDVVELQGPTRLLDVGGGIGHYTVSAAQNNSQLSGVILDRPEIVRLTRREIRKYGMSSRIEAMPLDIVNDKWPQGFDIVLLSNVLHSKSDSECRRIVRKAHSAVPRGGKVLINERIRRSDLLSTLFDITLLLCTPSGRLRTRSELALLTQKAGFSELKWKSLDSSQWVLMASKA